MEIDSAFDIKKYLEGLQLENHFNKRRLPSFKSNLFNLKKNSYNTLNSLNSYNPKNKNNLLFRNFSDSRISNTIDYNHNINHNANNIKKARFKKNKKNTKS